MEEQLVRLTEEFEAADLASGVQVFEELVLGEVDVAVLFLQCGGHAAGLGGGNVAVLPVVHDEHTGGQRLQVGTGRHGLHERLEVGRQVAQQAVRLLKVRP